MSKKASIAQSYYDVLVPPQAKGSETIFSNLPISEPKQTFLISKFTRYFYGPKKRSHIMSYHSNEKSLVGGTKVVLLKQTRYRDSQFFPVRCSVTSQRYIKKYSNMMEASGAINNQTDEEMKTL